MEIEASIAQVTKLEEISDLNVLPECFCEPLKTLWRATFGLRAAICPPLLYMVSLSFWEHFRITANENDTNNILQTF